MESVLLRIVAAAASECGELPRNFCCMSSYATIFGVMGEVNTKFDPFAFSKTFTTRRIIVLYRELQRVSACKPLHPEKKYGWGPQEELVMHALMELSQELNFSNHCSSRRKTETPNEDHAGGPPCCVRKRRKPKQT